LTGRTLCRPWAAQGIEAEILADFAKQNPQGLERIARFLRSKNAPKSEIRKTGGMA
jgi:hypothetical protein